MQLYLDLQKAITQATGGTTTKKEEQSVASDAESYVETTSGVSGHTAAYDDPETGKRWTHDEEHSLDNEVELQRQKRNAKAQQRNLVPTKEEVGDKKSFGESPIDMVKSLTSGLRDSLNLNKLTSAEVEFLHVIKGYSLEDIKRGSVVISGKDRRAFSAFLCDRAARALGTLYRR
jgi:hypothetical protein